MKKEFAVFERTNTRYWWNSKNSPEFGLMAHFFMTDISTRKDIAFTDWLDDPHITGIQGNATIIDLLEDGTIEIRNILDDGDFDDPVFRMPKEEYRAMVLKWQEIIATRPKEIIITWDGKHIHVEGKD